MTVPTNDPQGLPPFHQYAGQRAIAGMAYLMDADAWDRLSMAERSDLADAAHLLATEGMRKVAAEAGYTLQEPVAPGRILREHFPATAVDADGQDITAPIMVAIHLEGTAYPDVNPDEDQPGFMGDAYNL